MEYFKYDNDLQLGTISERMDFEFGGGKAKPRVYRLHMWAPCATSEWPHSQRPVGYPGSVPCHLDLSTNRQEGIYVFS